MNRLTDDLLDGGDAAEIDDRDDLAGDIRKAVTIARENLGRSLDRSGKAGCEEPLDGIPAFGGFEIACAAMEPFWLMVRTLLASSKWVCNPASHSSRCNIRKYAFTIHFGSAGSKPLGPFSMA
jgi:hypothetical protein